MRALILGLCIALLGALQLVPGAGVPDARATVLWTGGPDSPCYVASFNNYPAVCSRQMAYDACMQHNNYWKTHGSPNALGCVVTATVSGGIKGSYGSRLSSTNRVDYFNWGFSCPTGQTWDDLSKKCFDPSVCLAKPALGFSKIVGTDSVFSACSEGCRFEPGGTSLAIGNDDGSFTNYTTGWKATGAACGVGDSAPLAITTPQECVPAPDGQTFCIKADGEHCYSLPLASGNQVCWRPGQTGEKVSKNALQVRNAGSTPVEPSTPPPPGDSFQQAKAGVTKTSSVNGTTVTTTTTTYTTVNGTDAGGANAQDAGEPGDGSGSASGGTGGDGGFPDGCDDCDNSDGSAGHGGDSIWGADETTSFTADTSGLGFGIACPPPPTVLGQTMDFAAFCTLMQAIGLIVLAAAHMHALYIIVGE